VSPVVGDAGLLIWFGTRSEKWDASTVISKGRSDPTFDEGEDRCKKRLSLPSLSECGF
jgi:hypothetical protein